MTIHGDLSAFFGVKIEPVMTHAGTISAKATVTSDLSTKLHRRFELVKKEKEIEHRMCVQNPTKKWRGKTHENKLKQR